MGLAHMWRVSLLIHDFTILAMVPWYAQCRHEGGGTSGGGPGEDAVRTARMRRPPLRLTGWFVIAAVVLPLNGVCICAHPHALPPHACGGGCRRVPYSLAICSPFSRFIRHIRFIICASA